MPRAKKLNESVEIVNANVSTVPLPPLPNSAYVGLTVLFVLPSGKARPAMITGITGEFELFDLLVFMNGNEDGYAPDACVQQYGNISHSSGKHQGTWHFIEVK